MAKSKEKLQAIVLRKQGKSIKWIADELNVSAGSVSYWCREISLTPRQILALERQGRDPFYGKRLENVLRQKQARIHKEILLKNEGAREVGSLNRRELFLVGIALYWAEGFKKDSQVGLGSSDPDMMKLYVRWLKECFGYRTSDLLFRITFNKSHKYREEEIIRFWAGEFAIDASRFQKPFHQNTEWKKVYANPQEYYGVLRIRVRRSKDFLRKLYGYIEGLKQNSD